LHHRTARQFVAKFEENFGTREGLRCSRAPGRVNLIGEHTDYNGGFVMPMAIDREVRVLFRRADGGPVRLWSESYAEWDEFDLDGVERNESATGGWANYVRGVAAMLIDEGGELSPIEGIICGDVPIGAGLSSSAALEVATAGAFCAAAGIDPDPKELALLCQRAENRFVGVNCGIMDQFVSIHARREHALLLDCRSLEHELLPLDTSRLLNERVGGIEQLRDVTPEILAEHGDALAGETLKRARHVVSENERTVQAAEALRARDYARFGRLMDESHESLRDDYEVSCDELDLMVALARSQRGILGARMVGGGFGGCTVNLVERDRANSLAEAVSAAYRAQTGTAPEIYQFVAVAGAGVEKC